MKFDQEKYETLNAKRESGEPLKPAEKALLSQLEKAKGQSKSKPKASLTSEPDNAKKAKLIRFVAAERKALTERCEALKEESQENIKASLGSINAASEDLMVRAAVLALESMPDKKLIALMKKAQMNN